ncbi:MAG: LamG-like jellyroll fold domain-containing protein [Pseudomonadota bacterium]
MTGLTKGLALNIDSGNDNYLMTSGADEAFAGETEFTLEVSFSVDSEGSNFTPIVSYAAPGQANEFLIGAHNGEDTLAVFFKGQKLSTTIQKSDVFDGETHTVSVVRDASDGSIDVYVDGELGHSLDGVKTGQTLNGDGMLVVGQEQDSVGGGFVTNQVFSGEVNELRIFDEARTSDDIADNAGAPMSGDEAGLAAHWDFGAYADGGVADTTGGGADMTVGSVSGSGWVAGAGPQVVGGVTENVTGAVIGNVSVTDANSVDAHTITVDDSRFEVVDGQLKLKDGVSLDYETASSVALEITATDSEGASVSKSFALDVLNVDDADIVAGGDNADTLDGGIDNDTMTGGGGDDVFLGGDGADDMDGGDGIDTVDYSESSEGVEIYFGSSQTSSAAPTKADAGTVVGGDGDGDTITNIENAVTTDHDDFVYGGGEGNTVELRDGDDTFDNISANSGDDDVDGGLGDDSIKTGGGDDILHGGEGDDFLDGEQDDDTLYGGAGDDRMEGGDGGDVFTGGAGDDNMKGEVGDDLFLIGVGDGKDTVDGGAGWTDTVRLDDDGSVAGDWVVTVDGGDTYTLDTDSGFLDLGADASGVITFDDGTEIDFSGIEHVEW